MRRVVDEKSRGLGSVVDWEGSWMMKSRGLGRVADGERRGLGGADWEKSRLGSRSYLRN